MAARHFETSQPLSVTAAATGMTVAFARGGNPVAIKLALYALSPLQSALTRSMISCLGVSLLSMELHRKLKPKRDEIRPLLLLSLMYSLQIASNQTGADYTSAVHFTILMNTYPITVNLVSSLSVPEDRLTVRRICGLAIAFSGIIWVITGQPESRLASNPLLGNCLVLLAATILAVRTVYIRQLVLNAEYSKAVFWPLLGSVPLFFLGLVLIPKTIPRIAIDWTTVSAQLYQDVIVGGVGQLVWVYLMRRHTAGTVTALSFVTPISGLVLSSIVFNEPLSTRVLTGFCAVLTGIALVSKTGAIKEQLKPEEPIRGFSGSV